ncbi:MAG: OmpA family protein [Cyclobacteriaceae bacterium]
MKRNLILTNFLICLTAVAAMAQGSKSLADAEKFFGIKNYEQALPLFVEAIKGGATDPMIFYKAGVCHQKSNNLADQVLAIPYFEKALQNGKGFPLSLSYDLGELYLKDERIEDALTQFSKYKSLTRADKAAQAAADRAIETCGNALIFMSMARDFDVKQFPGMVNTEFTEYNPVVSADESVMAFTALRPNTGKTRTADKFIENIYISYNQSGAWTQPVLVPVASDYNVGTAGISPDGQSMIIFMGGTTDPGSLFQITKSGEEWSRPSILASTLNSKYLESTASITPDGKTLYFASDRMGGQGGMDIWKIERKADGNWGAPVNLGPDVNSRDNEDAPFIHPDQRTLFFTSDGHSTMGGRDIFKTKLANGKWTSPENLGYPINTTANDNYFTVLADGTRAFFSSDRKGGKGAQDIYFVDIPKAASNIALTMIKGKILDAETGKPMPTKMYVVDNETGKKVDFVYDPDPNTGNYLIILPPAKDYDIIIESEGFLPYTLNVNVPNQDYFYELYQQINLKTIKQFDVVVGQEVQVKNAFYDTHQDAKADMRKAHEAQLLKSGNVDAYDMMLDLMAANDTEGIKYLNELLTMVDPIENVNFNEKENSKLEVATRTYYYDESDESKFEKKELDGKTIFSLPTMVVAEEAKRNSAKKVAANYDKSLLNKTVKIFFDAGKSDLKQQFHAELDQMLASLKKYETLSVEISGFASAEGSEELNRELSNKRAIAVLDYLNHRGVVRRRIVAKGYGASRSESASKEEGRRVEVRIIAD